MLQQQYSNVFSHTLEETHFDRCTHATCDKAINDTTPVGVPVAGPRGGAA